MVRHIIDSLPSRVDTVVLAVSYMKEALEDYFRVNDCGERSSWSMRPNRWGPGGP